MWNSSTSAEDMTKRFQQHLGNHSSMNNQSNLSIARITRPVGCGMHDQLGVAQNDVGAFYSQRQNNDNVGSTIADVPLMHRTFHLTSSCFTFFQKQGNFSLETAPLKSLPTSNSKQGNSFAHGGNKEVDGYQFMPASYHDHMSHPKPLPEDKRINGRGGKLFPQRLHQLVEDGDEKFSDVISWMPHGRSFRVHDKKRFTNEILPKYFKQSMFASFCRQLSGYGFVRVRRVGPDKGTYYHELFLRGQSHLCTKIQRIRKDNIYTPPQSEPDFYSMKWISSKNLSPSLLPSASKQIDTEDVENGRAVCEDASSWKSDPKMINNIAQNVDHSKDAATWISEPKTGEYVPLKIDLNKETIAWNCQPNTAGYLASQKYTTRSIREWNGDPKTDDYVNQKQDLSYTYDMLRALPKTSGHLPHQWNSNATYAENKTAEYVQGFVFGNIGQSAVGLNLQQNMLEPFALSSQRQQQNTAPAFSAASELIQNLGPED